MSRTIFQQHEEFVTTPLPIALGGTGAHTAPEALVNLQLVDRVNIGQANGIAPLNADGQIPVQFLPPADVHSVSVSGKLTGYGLQTQTFKITDFDFDTIYNVSCDLGIINRSHDEIIYTPPNIAGVRTITINDNSYNIQITKSEGVKPIINYPLNNSVLIPLKPILTITNPSTIGISDIAIASHWEISQSSSFVGQVNQILINTGNLTLCPISTPLDLGVNYYVRVRYEFETLGLSEWSDTVSFETTTVSYTPPVNEEFKLIASDGGVNDYFGEEVETDATGTRIIVGSTNATFNGIALSGAAYIYYFNGVEYIQEAKLGPTGGVIETYFGAGVALSGDGTRAAIAAPYDNDGGDWAGAIYIFSRTDTTWTLETKIVLDDSMANTYFSYYSIAIDAAGSRVVAADYHATIGANTRQGAVRVFSRSGVTWTQEAKLVSDDGAANHYFGFPVAIDDTGTRIVAGAWNVPNGGNTSQGAAYVFTRDGVTWTQEAKIVASDGAAGDGFADSIDINTDGTVIIAGVPYHNTGGVNNQGAAYIFTRVGAVWSQEAKLVASDGLINDHFGNNVSLNADATKILVTSPGATISADPNAGKAYIFSRSNNVSTEEAILIPSVNEAEAAFGQTGSMTNDGDVVIIPAPYSTENGHTYAGSVYIYK